ncbi:hypothetical protein LTR56_016461 [Elasticomyces elasticus]|nr:hypothetical protein LTR22_027817 [Elasticomyces elasticus]KAK3632220.1 hypothetical protein LTR56_016461 [Elasticomyces elasticus]
MITGPLARLEGWSVARLLSSNGASRGPHRFPLLLVTLHLTQQAHSYLLRRLDSVPASTVIWSLIPFILTWLATASIAHYKLYPILSRDATSARKDEGLPQFNKDSFKATTHTGLSERIGSRGISAVVFSTSIGLSTVLVELLLCEISNALNPAARGLALRVTLSSLLVLSILVTPALELRGLGRTIVGMPNDDTTSTNRYAARRRFRFVLEAGLLVCWLVIFWYLPQTSILRSTLHRSDVDTHLPSNHAFTEACLERVGIIGTSLMASLAGFAAVSNLWQTFGVRHRVVRDTDIARKEACLHATEEMQAAKQSRLRALQRKMSETVTSPSNSSPISPLLTMGRSLATAIHGGTSGANEQKALQTEISGLETMRYQLSISLSALRSEHTSQQLSRTTRGRVANIASTVCAVYCAYRIVSTSIFSLRRLAQPSGGTSSSDPITNVLALLTTHYDSDLDRAAWSRQISFLISGVMLLASFNAVLQTFRLFARFGPVTKYLHHSLLSSRRLQELGPKERVKLMQGALQSMEILGLECPPATARQSKRKFGMFQAASTEYESKIDYDELTWTTRAAPVRELRSKCRPLLKTVILG